MARQKNDGRGRLGGRAKGTPNRDSALKIILRQHSQSYFMPGDDGISQFELDAAQMAPHERAALHEKILRYHTAPMQAVTADMTVNTNGASLEQRLANLADGVDEVSE